MTRVIRVRAWEETREGKAREAYWSSVTSQDNSFLDRNKCCCVYNTPVVTAADSH